MTIPMRRRLNGEVREERDKLIMRLLEEGKGLTKEQIASQVGLTRVGLLYAIRKIEKKQSLVVSG